MDAARQLDFRPHPLASGLRGGRTQMIGVLWSLARESANLLRAITLDVQDHGYQVQTRAMTPDAPNISAASWTNWPVEACDAVIMRWDRGRLSEKIRQEILSQLSQFRAAVVVPGYHQDLPIGPGGAMMAFRRFARRWITSWPPVGENWDA